MNNSEDLIDTKNFFDLICKLEELKKEIELLKSTERLLFNTFIQSDSILTKGMFADYGNTKIEHLENLTNDNLWFLLAKFYIKYRLSDHDLPDRILNIKNSSNQRDSIIKLLKSDYCTYCKSIFHEKSNCPVLKSLYHDEKNIRKFEAFRI